jgi:DNA repair protein RadD
MVKLGFWSKLEYQTAAFDSSELIYNTAKSEYTDESVLKAFKNNDIQAQITQQLNEHADRKHILVFVPSIREAMEMARQYPESAAIHSNLKSAERADIIDRFRGGAKYAVFSTCGYFRPDLTTPASTALFSAFRPPPSPCTIRL